RERDHRGSESQGRDHASRLRPPRDSRDSGRPESLYPPMDRHPEAAHRRGCGADRRGLPRERAIRRAHGPSVLIRGHEMKTTIGSAALASAAALLLIMPPAFAHHSFPAQYDAEKPVTLTGTVTRV